MTRSYPKNSWYVAGLSEKRGSSAAEMAAALDAAGVPVGVRLCASPVDAWRQALAAAGADDRVLVFGSFATVGAVLRELEASGARPL